MQFRIVIRRAALVAATLWAGTACTALDSRVLAEGAVAGVEGNRVVIAPLEVPRVAAGQLVRVYQPVEHPAVDPDKPAWRPLEPVATARVLAVEPGRVTVELRDGAVEHQGPIQLRGER